MEDQLNFSSNALIVLNKRYLKKNNKGEVIEIPQELLLRVAKAIASTEERYGASADGLRETEKVFFEMMKNLEFMPNSPTLMNAGKDLGQLSACFVVPVEDSMESIFDAIKSTALIHKTGGGTGFSFSRLRPKSSVVKSTGGVASGPVSFMKVFDSATQAVKQGGCVAPETRISTGKGLAEIKHLGPADAAADSWHKYNPHPVVIATDNGRYLADEFYNHGVSTVRTIKTKNNYKITATLQHRLRVIDKKGEYVWRHIKDIKVGDWVVLQKDSYLGDEPLVLSSFSPHSVSKDRVYPKPHFNATPVNIPKKATPELGEFIGYLVGDGAISLNKRGTGRLILTISDKEKDVTDRILRIARKLFGITAIAQKKKDDLSTNYFFNSTHLVKWLQYLGVDKPSTHQAYIPELVFKGGRAFAKGFLRGLFSADGTVTKEGYPSICTVSRILIEDLQQLLLSLGMPSGVSITRNRKNAFGKRALYRLRIVTQEGIEQFMKEIGFISKRKNKRLLNRSKKRWEFNDVIPNQEKRLLKIYGGPGRGCAQGRKARGANRPLYRSLQHYLPDVVASRNLTRLRLRRLADLHPEISSDSILSWFLTNKQFYDRVVDVREKQSLTLDLSVPGSNTYIANGFVSHNTRRGANMGMLRVDHPDILEFIKCKKEEGEIANFNISVAITDDFMEKALNDENYQLIDPHSGQKTGELNAREVFNTIAACAHKNGEPGVVFIDKVNKNNPTINLGKIESTNPCGEQPLLPYESCNLGSINLSKMLKKVGGSFAIDWNRLKEVTRYAVRFLDNVIDNNKFPLPQIRENTLRTRKIGLGVMGWATLLGFLGIPYDSDEAISLARRIMDFIYGAAREESITLAKEREVFPAWEGSLWHKRGIRIRNATLTTIAPTGTISIIAGPTSSGVEPNFSLCYFRNVLDGEKLLEIDPAFEYTAKREGFYSQELMEKIARGENIQEINEIPPQTKRVFRTAMDISPFWHIKMQAAFQEFTDNAVSKTINLPNSATVDDVKEGYLLAYKLNCKGVTVYRDGSRSIQVLTRKKKKADEQEDQKQKEEESPATTMVIPYPKPRPEVILGTTTKVTTGCGNLFITVNQDEEGSLFEVFTQMGKAGGCAASQLEAVGRLVSLALRGGIDIKVIVEQLKGIRCPSPSWDKGKKIFSCADAIARVLEKRGIDQRAIVKVEVGAAKDSPPQGKAVTATKKTDFHNVVGVCIECGYALRHQEGCLVCDACGYSKC